jgi:hypothetical protein
MYRNKKLYPSYCDKQINSLLNPVQFRLDHLLLKEGIDLKKIRSTFKNKIKKGGPKDRPFSLIILINYF